MAYMTYILHNMMSLLVSYLYCVYKCLQNAGVTLNKDKCQFNQKSIKFLGRVVSADRVTADPSMAVAILSMKQPIAQ